MKEKELLNNDQNPLGFENKGIEIISKRGKREKHFLQKDGSFIAQMYSDDIHFKKNGKYEEIDNRLEKVSEYYKNKNNSFDVYFKERSKGELLRYELQEGYIGFELMDDNDVSLQIIDGNSKFTQTVKYENIFGGIDFEYLITPTKVKENIIIKEKEFIPEKISFILHTNFELKLTKDGNIAASIGDNDLFTLDVPYMIDTTQVVNNNIRYELIKINDMYNLKLVIDKKKIYDSNLSFPIIIDPTISTYSEGEVYDTYIYPGDTNINRNSQGVLKAGVERINGKDVVNRALVKFDLPKIGTGSQIYEAFLTMVGYPFYDQWYVGNLDGNYADVHRITQDWTEEDANWEKMNDKYESKIEASNFFIKGALVSEDFVTYGQTGWEITSLVQKWYLNEPNYGVLIKAHNEVYADSNFPQFYSKNNNVSGDNPKPTLEIVYRNQNGLENYMNIESQTFSEGEVYENTFNGNMIAMFNLGETFASKLPVDLKLVYNTNDVILEKNSGFGIGYKLNLYQTINETKISETDYLEYLDEDGTIHFFIKSGDIYIEEDNLNITIESNENEYILNDKYGNQSKFIKSNGIGYLAEYKELTNNKINIFYDPDNRINKIVDSDNQEINIFYKEDQIEIISPLETIYLKYSGSNLIKIVYNDGNIDINYDSKKCIINITDKDNKKIEFQYYELLPYRVKEIVEYGINGGRGSSFYLNYGFKTTEIADNKNRTTTIIFNDMGMPISFSNLKNREEIKNAYSIVKQYGEYEHQKNKFLSDRIPVKYVKNYLSDTSFENGTLHFTSANEKINLAINNEVAYSGKNSLKIFSNENRQFVTYEISGLKGNYYTYSCYLKNNTSIKIGLEYLDSKNNVIKSESKEIYKNNEFERHEVTIYYPENATSNLFIKIYLISVGDVYVDDMQLEEGEVANQYNYVDNSDFSAGLEGWNASSGDNDTSRFQITNLNDGTPVLKIKMDPIIYTSLSKKIIVSGKKGDSYTISFWYKHGGHGFCENTNVLISPNYTGDYIGDWHPQETLNSNDTIWQYFTKTMIMADTYDSITISLNQQDVNELFVTNLSVFKDVANNYYDYDLNGNVIEEVSFSNDISKFNYDKNNQLIGMTSPKGKKFVFEYDNVVKDRVVNGITESGISNKYKYDDFGNPVLMRIENKGITKKIGNGKYQIRLKGTNKYFRNINNKICFSGEHCSHDVWIVEQEQEYFKIKHGLIENKFLTFYDNKLILSSFQNNNSLFEFKLNENGSYSIRLKGTNKYIKVEGENIEFIGIMDIDEAEFQFYFESIDSKIFIENNTIYDSDGKFVVETLDENLHKTKYVIDEKSGLTKSITNAKNQTLFYDYNEKYQLKKIEKGDRSINYEYNDSNLLSKIIQEGKTYNLIYNEFSKIDEVKIGDSISLLKYNYEPNNGNLVSVSYGNGHSITSEYDEFDRVLQLKKMNDVYSYKYGNNGDLMKVMSNDHIEQYVYDLGKRLRTYLFDDFKIDYDYDTNGSIRKTKYNLDIVNETVEAVVNDEEVIEKTISDLGEINYEYDNIGRLLKSTINDNCITIYKYISNGNRTSNLVESIANDNDIYSYKYDKLNNITHIYHNGVLENRYFYDMYNALISENNYVTGETIRYKYDKLGNIVFKAIYELNSYNCIKQDKYSYSTSDWKDQLTKFNDSIITYDKAGNVININDQIHLSWINGRELQTYSTSDKILNYKYNKNGIRINKKINNISTEYFIDNDEVIFERTGDNVIYYLRNEVDNLIGFKYNNDIYYYVKNNQDDIIKLLDSHYNTVVTYQYDSWGNILAITDVNGVSVIDNDNHIANINPYRYRSYYYDIETGLYYLKSRYYNPKWGRFISPDNAIIQKDTFTGNNMYVYVDNNPINNVDDDGNFSLKKAIKKAVKKVAKAAKKVVKKVIKVVKKTVKVVKKAVKSAITYVVNKVTSAKITPSASVGIGIGAKAGVKGVEAGYSNDWTLKWDDGKFVTGNEITLGIGAKVGTKQIGPNSEYFHTGHYVNGDLDESTKHSQPFPLIHDIGDCEQTDKSISGNFTGKKNQAASLDSESMFIGIDINAHLGVGGHIRLGFDISW